MIKSVQYDDLEMNARINCINGYINKICPHEDFEEYTVGDMEYNVREFLEIEDSYIIDESGDWYEISLKRL